MEFKDKRKIDVITLELKEKVVKVEKNIEDINKQMQSFMICNSGIETKINLIYDKLVKDKLLEEINTMQFQIKNLWKGLYAVISTLIITFLAGVFNFFTK